jgi:hypothetical protein
VGSSDATRFLYAVSNSLTRPVSTIGGSCGCSPAWTRAASGRAQLPHLANERSPTLALLRSTNDDDQAERSDQFIHIDRL